LEKIVIINIQLPNLTRKLIVVFKVLPVFEKLV